MSYQPNSGRTSSDRPRGFDKPKKTKTKKLIPRHSNEPRQEETGAMPLKETISWTLKGLENLGIQTFAIPPFSQHFDRWLKSLITVLDDFEENPEVKPDDRFHRERGEILYAIDAALKAEQANEASHSDKILSLHNSKDLLFQLEKEYNAKIRDHSTHREKTLKTHTNAIKTLQNQLNETLETKAGLLEAFTKNKTKKEQEARSRITLAENQLNTAKASFMVELTGLQSEYEHQKREVFEKIAAKRREIEKLEAEVEIDGSVEVRSAACEELASAVKALVERINDSEKTQKK